MKAIINSAAQVRSAKPGAYRVNGAGGLYLRKGENGSGSWVYRYSLGRKRREMGLGTIAEVSLDAARAKAAKLALERNDDHDPIDLRAKRRAEATAKARSEAKKVTFAQAAASYLAAHGPSWRHRYSRASWWGPVRNYALPVIGDLPLDDIQIEHVVAVMQSAEKAGAKETARRVRARIEAVLDTAIATGRRDAARLNPAGARLIAKVHPSKRKGEHAHHRAVALDDAPAIFRELKRRGESATPNAAWAFMIATAARPSEALNARWAEIDLDKGLWTIPGARMKSARAHNVPLSAIALAVLERQATVRAGDAVFPGASASPLSYNAFATAPTKAGIDAGTPHSWRSIFRDWAGDIGRIDRDLAEAALAHSLGETERAYRRRTAVEARRQVMEAYARWLLSEGADVIAFPTRA
jgi:integrase